MTLPLYPHDRHLGRSLFADAKRHGVSQACRSPPRASPCPRRADRSEQAWFSSFWARSTRSRAEWIRWWASWGRERSGSAGSLGHRTGEWLEPEANLSLPRSLPQRILGSRKGGSGAPLPNRLNIFSFFSQWAQ